MMNEETGSSSLQTNKKKQYALFVATLFLQCDDEHTLIYVSFIAYYP